MDDDNSYGYTNPDFDNKRRKRKILIILAVIILGIIVLISALSSSGSEEQSSNSSEATETAVEVCEDEECFREKFFSCQPASFDVFEDEEAIEYIISEPTETGCLTTLRYLAAEDQELAGREMTCNMENQIGFRSAGSLALSYPQDYGCTGDLTEQL